MSGAQNAPRCRPFVTIGYSLGCFFTRSRGTVCSSKRLFAFSLLLSLGRMLQPWKRRGLSRRRRACRLLSRLGDVRRRGHPAPRSRLRRAFFMLFFCKPSAQENQGVISTKISWQKSVTGESPDREIFSNPRRAGATRWPRGKKAGP